MFLTTVITFFLAHSIEGRISPIIESRIQNGESTAQDEIPYVVSLQFVDTYHFCGGSILNEDYVLTAAHCINNTVINLRPERIRVTTGYNRKQPVSVHSVSWLIEHEYYMQRGAYFNDIALLKVTPPFVFNEQVAPVTLPEPNFEVALGTTALMVGWGETVTKNKKRKGTKPQILQKLRIEIGGDHYCKLEYMARTQIFYTSHICTVIPYGKPRSACTGDSGGPLTIDGNLLVGVASTSPQNDDLCSLYPTVYTKVSHFIDWISRNTVGLFDNEIKRQYYENNDRIIFLGE